MRLMEYLLAEGFFKNNFSVTQAEVKKLSPHYAKNWSKGGTSWTMHDGDNHLFTYNTKTGELMTDKSKAELSKIIKIQ